MTLHLYGPDFNRKTEIGWRATYALSEGLNALGVEHEVRETKYFEGDLADRVIVNGWIKAFIDGRSRPTRNDVIRAHQAAGKDIWCIERGFLGDRDEWSAISINGFGVNGGDFRAEGMPSDRWDKLGIELQPWKTGGDYILFCCQVPWDAQVDGSDHIQWIRDAFAEIRTHTKREVRFRGHPKAWRQRQPYQDLPFVGLREQPKTTFEEDLEGAHCVVCFNSNCATVATIHGVPAFTGAQSMADPIANPWIPGAVGWTQIENPPRPRDGAREQWAWNLAYKQWNVEEFRQALPWLHLTREVACAKTS